ncbi:5'-adenylylsulfate reductase-like 3 isoform X2 [Cryptomeria japonica]|uniref:5'-adenylylsulfate reductase-like 3 isoform X2 n=1 Tax=Cryptomeria japonica TaxID=3369 RepID=UPI0025ABD6E4|nr:5'-adenylylsulfate reductase-like 3 isoform X2 [Cryptomeria japonica]
MAGYVCRLIIFVQFISLGMAMAEKGLCRIPSIHDAIFQNLCASSDLTSDGISTGFLQSRVAELDEVSLERALNILHKSGSSYMAVLFYASWCPFSKLCQPVFNTLSSMFPTIHHVAIEESAIRPRYGVHSFPSIVLQNQTMRVRYTGSRKLESFVAFYKNITGIEPVSPYLLTLVDGSSLRGLDMVKDIENEKHCPYSWAKSPEKLLQEDNYLTLAILFLVSRMLYFLFPKVLLWLKRIWNKHVFPADVASTREYSPSYMERILYIFNRNRIMSSLKFYKTGNFQGGAMNARAWASKSLASVSLGEGSSSKAGSNGEGR